MNTQVTSDHMPHPDDEKILGMLASFDEHANEGFLRILDSDKVYVVFESDAHKQLQTAVSGGKAFSLGVTEHEGKKFALYSVNESFFKS